MVLLRDAYLRRAVEEPINGDPRLHAGERSPGATMGAAPEREVIPRVGAIDLELRRVRKVAGIPVGRAVEHHECCSRRDVDAADGRRAPREPKVPLHRGLDPQGFLDEARDKAPLLPQEALEVRPLAD